MEPALAWLDGFYKGLRSANGEPPRVIYVSKRLYDDYEDTLIAMYRFVGEVEEDIEPWLIYKTAKIVVNHAWDKHDTWIATGSPI